MLNYNLNIIGTLGKSRIGAGPDIQPTTTTTTTTTSTTTTTVGPISVRTDPYSASLVYAVPGALFDGLGQQSVRSDISSYIRGTGASLTDAQLPLTSSFTGSLSGSFTAYSGSVKWAGYSTSLGVSGALCIYATASNDDKFSFPSQDFTVEAWIAYATASVVQGINPPFSGPEGQNGTLYYNYEGGMGFLSNGTDNSLPGVRFVIRTDAGADIYYDSAILNRSAYTWYHIGAQRSGSLFSSLWSGSAVQSFTYSGNLATGSAASASLFYIFNTPYDKLKQHFYQDFRIYNGIAKYPNANSGSTYTTPDSMIIP